MFLASEVSSFIGDSLYCTSTLTFIRLFVALLYLKLVLFVMLFFIFFLSQFIYQSLVLVLIYTGYVIAVSSIVLWREVHLCCYKDISRVEQYHSHPLLVLWKMKCLNPYLWGIAYRHWHAKLVHMLSLRSICCCQDRQSCRFCLIDNSLSFLLYL